MAGKTTWLHERCREKARRAVGICAALAFLALLPASCAWRDVRGAVFGATRADAAYFERATRGIVEVDAAGAVDTGVFRGQSMRSGAIEIPIHDERSRSYYAVPMGEQALVIETKDEPLGLVVGRLEGMPTDLRLSLPEGRFLPLVLRTDAPTRLGWIALVATVLGLGAAGYFGLRQAKIAADPALHRAARRVAEWGDPDELSAEIRGDIEEAPYRQAGKVFGARYFVHDAWGAFDVRRWADLLWIYPLRIQRRSYGIPVGASWYAVAHFRDGKCEFYGSEADVRAFVARAHVQAPWAAAGYDERTAEDFADRPGAFRTNVRKRREAMEAGTVPPSPQQAPRPAPRRKR
jgi:hypothetical protein